MTWKITAISMKKAIASITLVVFALIVFNACERERDFNPDFPSRAILGSGPYLGPYWPTDSWKSCSPEEVGMDSELLRQMNEDLVLQRRLHVEVHSVLVIRKGYIVAEQYYSDEFAADSLHPVYSCTKSVTSAAFGIARDKGFIPSLETPLLDFFPEYQVEDPSGKDRITLRHALTMSDGLEWYETQYPYSDERNTFNEWQKQEDKVQFVLDRPLIAEPGTSFSYNSGISQLLSIVLQEQTGKRLDSFARQELFDPLGIGRYRWLIEPDGSARGYSSLYLTSRDLAKFGLLYLREGVWEDRQLVPAQWVAESTSRQILRGDIPGFYYGYQWWVHEAGLIAAVGYGGQLLMLIPGYDLLVLFTNYHNELDDFQMSTPWRLLDNFIVPAIRD